MNVTRYYFYVVNSTSSGKLKRKKLNRGCVSYQNLFLKLIYFEGFDFFYLHKQTYDISFIIKEEGMTHTLES